MIASSLDRKPKHTPRPQHGLAPSQVEIDHTHALYSSGFDGLLQLDEGTCGQPLASSEYGQPPQRPTADRD